MRYLQYLFFTNRQTIGTRWAPRGHPAPPRPTPPRCLGRVFCDSLIIDAFEIHSYRNNDGTVPRALPPRPPLPARFCALPTCVCALPARLCALPARLCALPARALRPLRPAGPRCRLGSPLPLPRPLALPRRPQPTAAVCSRPKLQRAGGAAIVTIVSVLSIVSVASVASVRSDRAIALLLSSRPLPARHPCTAVEGTAVARPGMRSRWWRPPTSCCRCDLELHRVKCILISCL